MVHFTYSISQYEFFLVTSYLYHTVWFFFIELCYFLFFFVCSVVQITFSRTTFTPNVVCIFIYYLRIPCEQFLIGG